jgi:PAS domain S-box-containing protein
MIAKDGRVIWLADFVSIVVDKDAPVLLRGVMVDITSRKKAEEELVNERKLLRLLIDNLPDYIYVKDKDSRHIINNRAYVKLLGFDSEDKTVGKTIGELIGKDLSKGFTKDDWHVLNTGEPIIDNEEPIQTASHDSRWLLTTKIPFKDEQDNVIGLVGISHDITERKKAEGELKEKNSQLKQLSSHLQDVREQERKSLAREVHDELGQLASAVKMDIDWLKIKLPGLEEVYKNRIAHASSTAGLLISTIRKVALELRPGMLDELGLNASLEWKCKDFESANSTPCIFTSNFDDGDLTMQVKTMLFRICQEALINVMRHAEATRVTVDIRERNGTVQLCITDNGKGFDTSQKISNTLGLVSMRERCASINGTLIINSEKGSGTVVYAIIPKANIML